MADDSARSLLARYLGRNAATYDHARVGSPKWDFEQSCLEAFVGAVRNEVRHILDVPVGTGRFLDTYARLVPEAGVAALDLSDDMLSLARARSKSTAIRFRRHDIVTTPAPLAADLVVCFRFLNLINAEDMASALGNILSASERFCILSVRVVDDAFPNSLFIEDKIWLHKESEFEKLPNAEGFAVEDMKVFGDKRLGSYRVLLLRRCDEEA